MSLLKIENNQRKAKEYIKEKEERREWKKRMKIAKEESNRYKCTGEKQSKQQKNTTIVKIFKSILFPGSQLPDLTELKLTFISWNTRSQIFFKL